MAPRACKFIVAMCLTAVAHDTQSTGVALGPLYSAQLAGRCRVFQAEPDSKDGLSCSAYVRGFIDGSPHVLVLSRQQSKPSESFTDRAARTRLGRLSPSRPQYCIDASLSMRDLVAQILATADAMSAGHEVDATVLLHETFALFHKCTAPPR
jgi:hypothetical protein